MDYEETLGGYRADHTGNYLSIEDYIDYCINERIGIHEFTDGLIFGIHENVFGRIIGGLTGLALGKAIGRFLIKSFQIQEGTVLHKLFSSRLFFMAVGAAFGKSTKTVDSTKD